MGRSILPEEAPERRTPAKKGNPAAGSRRLARLAHRSAIRLLLQVAWGAALATLFPLVEAFLTEQTLGFRNAASLGGGALAIENATRLAAAALTPGERNAALLAPLAALLIRAFLATLHLTCYTATLLAL